MIQPTKKKQVVAVHAGCAAKLRYVLRDDNKVLARVMDAGKYRKGVIRNVDTASYDCPGVRIRVHIKNL